MIPVMATSADLPTDGRVQRSERSREAIVRALLALIGEGTLSPTAQQVAERADVGVRTVFRHFSDMETLFAAMNDRIAADVDELFVATPQSGPLAARVDGLVDRRSTIFERIGPYLRSSALQRRRSEFLQAQHDRNIRILRRDLENWLPELDSAAPECADALELLLSFEAWNRLRSDQKLGPRRAAGVLRRGVGALVRTVREKGSTDPS